MADVRRPNTCPPPPDMAEYTKTSRSFVYDYTESMDFCRHPELVTTVSMKQTELLPPEAVRVEGFRKSGRRTGGPLRNRLQAQADRKLQHRCRGCCENHKAL